MKLSSFLVVKTVISLLFGIGFVLMPAVVMSIYGVTLDSAGILMAQYFGACLIGIGLACWLFKYGDPDALKCLTLALFVADTLGFIISMLGISSGLVNALGWLNVAIWLFLALGLGYFRFMKSGILQ